MQIHITAERTARGGKTSRALEYQNERVVKRIMRELKITAEVAEELFMDTKRFLALSDQGVTLVPPPTIDKAWHEFILFTWDYAKFCKEYIGHFVHHFPSRADETSLRENTEKTRALATEEYGHLSDNWQYGCGVAPCDGTGGEDDGDGDGDGD